MFTTGSVIRCRGRRTPRIFHFITRRLNAFPLAFVQPSRTYRVIRENEAEIKCSHNIEDEQEDGRTKTCREMVMTVPNLYPGAYTQSPCKSDFLNMPIMRVLAK